MAKALNLLEKKFNRLTVIERLPNDKNGKSMWLCKCECGSEVEIRGSHIKRGDIQSCGCLLQEETQKRATQRKLEHQVDWECAYCHKKEKRKKSRAKRKYCSKECYNNSIYTGISLPENRAMRQTEEYREWRTKIFKADNFTCQNCGVQGGPLNAHHLKSFTQYPELRFDVNNGVTLCRECHNKFHKIYGKIDFTEEDYYEFIIK